MVRCYDNWEKLVEAVIRREQLRQLSLEDSRSPSVRSLDSDFSFSSSSWQDNNISFRQPPSPLLPDVLKLKLAQNLKDGKQIGSRKVNPKRRNAMWKGLFIFSGFSSKKDYGREKDYVGDVRELERVTNRRTLYGLQPMNTSSIALSHKHSFKEVSLMAEEAKRKAEFTRMQELHTLKGHIESLVKAKGLDLDLIPHYYTV